MVAALQYRIHFLCAKYVEVQDTFAKPVSWSSHEV